jgi:ubiquitin-protein ligase
MYQSPRVRRLRNDLSALERLRSESSIFRFVAQGELPQQYHILFQGKGLWRDRGKVRFHETHRIEIKLGASYPRAVPEIRWLTPIYHPNISEIGMVCLGGYGTHWVPSVQLDELCIMLWDMLRYHNYDIRSPYNRDAALWVANQTVFLFPTDPRPLRDLRAALGRVASVSAGGKEASSRSAANGTPKSESAGAGAGLNLSVGRVREFVGRYRRRSGSAELPGSPIPNSNPGPAPSHPELQALFTAEVHSGLAGNAGLGSDRDPGVVILESSAPAPVEREATQSASDDIVFID